MSQGTGASPFDIEHPHFNLKMIERNRDLYEGLAHGAMRGKSAEDVKKYLFRNDSESDKSYENRVKRAAYINLAAPVADLFSSVVTGNIGRSGLWELSDFVPMQKNCDRQHNTPDKFFKSIVAQAAPIGAHFVLVDRPSSEVDSVNGADISFLGLTPYFVSIPAESVYSWDYELDGSLSYVMLRGVQMRSSGPMTPFVEVQTRELWTKTGWQRFEAEGGKDFTLVGEGDHPCGVVPIVPFLFEQSSQMTGLSVFDDVAENIVQVFNCWSELDKDLANSSLPWLFIMGIPPEDAMEMIRASDSAVVTNQAGADAKYIESSGVSFAAKQAQIDFAIKYITNVSLRRTRPDSAAAISAESKREDNRELVALMNDFARNMQDCERQCWQLAGKWLGLSSEAMESVDVVYEVKYDVDEVAEGTIQTLIDLVGSKIFSAEFMSDVIYRTHFIQERLSEEQRKNGFDPIEERTRIENESRGASGPSGNLAGSLTAALMGQGG